MKCTRPPGQVHFVFKLKVDLYGVCSCRAGKNFIFALTEEHWPGDKTADSVLSMLRHITDLDIEKKGAGNQLVWQQITVAARTKISSFCATVCHVSIRQQKLVRLSLPIPAYTKNKAHGTFGNVQRCLNGRDTTVPVDMTRTIEDSKATG